MNTNKSQQISISFYKYLLISLIFLFLGTLLFFSQKNFSIIPQPTTKAQSSYPQCQQGRIISPCQCGNQIYNAGFCCYHPNANSGIWFDPSYEDLGGCPTGNFYFVDQNHPNASDENSGTEEEPWKSLGKACNAVQVGDMVIVKEGVYIDSISNRYSTFNPTNSGSPGNPIIFRSIPRRAAIIRTYGLPNRSRYAWAINHRDYIIIDGFKIEGGAILRHSNYSIIKNCDISIGRCPSNDPSLNWGLTLYDAKYCTLENNYIHDISDSGNRSHNTACVMVFSGSEDNIIQNNLADAGNGIVYSAFGQKGGAIYNNTWRYNIARNATTGFLGMAATAEDVASEDNIYYQNIAINCKTTAFELYHMCYRFKIYNNVAFECSRFVSAFKNNNIDTELWNNIAVGENRTISWGGYPEAMPFSILINYSDYNDFYGYSLIGFREKTPTLYYYTLEDWQNGTGFDMNSMYADPLFLNPTSHNFHLQPSSPCLNAGIDRQDYDNDGNTTESINMGAYITGNETIGLIDLSQYIVEEPQPNSCASQNGVCCNENQICQNGTFISSSDCGNLCCTGECVSPSVPGDLNQDNKVNSLDFQILIQKFKETQNIEIEDLNSDGIVDVKDIGILMHYWTN